MLQRKFLWAGALTSLAAAALAHNGATGVVMDRMMGMTAMKDIMASLAPMMRGEVPFDVKTVQESAVQIMSHSGENMTRLFPEGSLQTASFAKPGIWEEWEDFEALSEQLKAYALGLGMAAPNGLTTPEPTVTASAGGTMDHSTMQMEASEPSEAASGETMDHSTMQMEPSSTATPGDATPAYTVAELMGVTRPAAVAQPSAATSLEDAKGFAMLAADDAFEMVSQICSACHARFRTGS